MNEIVVSICCLTYNHASHLQKCLEGFVMQQCDFRYEVLIHDDASTDDTVTIIKKFQEKYPDIIKPIFQSQNQYSQGIRHLSAKHNFPRAEGKFIAMCEGDDYWTSPKKLQMQVDFLNNHPEFSMCFYNAEVMYCDSEKDSHLFNNLNKSGEITLEQVVDNWIIPTASILFRKSILPFPGWVSQVYSGDMSLALTALKYGKIYYHNEVMSVYNIAYKGNSASATVARNSDFILEQHALLFTLYDGDTGYKHTKMLSKKVKHLKDQRRYLKYRHKFLLLPLAMMPFFVLKKLAGKISNGS